MHTKIIGVILMTYGSATTSGDVEPFLRHVYPDVPKELVDEFKRRFDIVGSSPLIAITKAQAKKVENLLNQQTSGTKYQVEAGMLHSDPFIADAVAKLKKGGCTTILGVLMSPQYSPHIMRGYDDALAAAAKASGYNPQQVKMAGPWPVEPKFVEMLATSLRKLRSELSAKYNTDIPVVFTTHSLPEKVVQRDPSYLDQLQETADTVASQVGLGPTEYSRAYQSAGHTPEEWLKPDLNDVVAQLHAKQVSAVIVVPIQFLADHLEILYDLDTAAREETTALGVHYHRLPVANTNPLFIEALSDIVRRQT
jgi:ferrochelatase